MIEFNSCLYLSKIKNEIEAQCSFILLIPEENEAHNTCWSIISCSKALALRLELLINGPKVLAFAFRPSFFAITKNGYPLAIG